MELRRWSFPLLVALVALTAGSGTVSLAGPNADGVLLLHANRALTYTIDTQDYCGQSALAACSLAVATVPWAPDTTRVFYVLAAFPAASQPRLKALAFGVDWDPDKLIVLGHGSCGDFEIPDNSWPAPGTGTGLSWSQTQTDLLVDVYWFAAYTYTVGDDPDTTSFALIPHPTQGAVMVDDAIPPNEDAVAAFGRLGFGTAGSAPCPGEVDSGGDSGGGSEEPGGSGDEPENPGGESPPADTENCAPNVVLIRFSPDEVSFPQENPALHEHFVLPLSSAEFSRSDLYDRLADLGIQTFETIAPNWRHMSEEEEVDVHGRHVNLVDFTDVYLVQLDGRASLEQVITDLQGRSGIEFVVCDPIGSSFALPDAPNDPWYPCQWYLDFAAVDSCDTQACGQDPPFDINAPEAWALQDSAGTWIGISDRAIHGSLPGLSDYIDRELSRSFVPNQGWSTDNPGSHGTFVASIAAAGTDDALPLASLANLPPNYDDSLIVALRVDASDARGAQALDYVRSGEVDNRIRVVNHSWGHPSCKLSYGYNPVLRDAFRNAFISDIALVCASGNDLPCGSGDGCDGDTCFAYPAAFADYALAVAAVDCDGNTDPDYKVGSYIDLAAPGGRICYLDEGGVTCPDTIFTSYSAPLASGAIALLLGADPDLYNEDCYNILKVTARPIDGAPEVAVGTGLLQVDEALRLVLPPRQLRHGSTNSYQMQKLGEGWLWIRNGPGQIAETWNQRWAATYRLTSTVFIPDSLVEHIWPLGRTSSGGPLIDEHSDFHYDLKLRANLADVERIGGTGAVFTSYTYHLFISEGGDSLGWYPFNPYDGQNPYRLDYSYIAQGSLTGDVDDDGLLDAGGSLRIHSGDGETILAWQQSSSGATFVTLYDVRGREVRRMLSPPQLSSHRLVSWDNRDSAGREVASGVYFVAVVTELGGAKSQRLVGRTVVVR